MKQLKLWMLAAILTFCGSMVFTACTDEIDNPVEPVVDPLEGESFINDEMMDRTVKPGDDFFEYALGTWLKNHSEYDPGKIELMAGIQWNKQKEAFFESDNPLAQHIVSLIDQDKDFEEAFGELLSLLYDMGLAVDLDEEPTRQMIIAGIAKMVDAGYTPFVKRTVSSDKGRFVKVLTSGNPNEDLLEMVEIDEDYAIDKIADVLSSLQDEDEGDDDDDDDVDLEAIAREIIKIEQMVAECHNEVYSDNLNNRQTAMPTRALKPSQLPARSRGAEGMTEADIYEALGVADDNSRIDEKVLPIVEYLLEGDLKVMSYFMVYHFLNEYIQLLPGKPTDQTESGEEEDEDSDEDFQEIIYQKLEHSAPELLTILEYPTFKGLKTEQCRTIMEQMRSLMDQRISNLDWMSAPTKAAARKKLAAMKFNIGIPDELPDLHLTLTGESLYEDIQQLRQQRQEGLMALVGQPIADKGWDMLIHFFHLGIFNACYEPTLNQLFILPAFLTEEMLPEDNDAMCYATAMVFGHEMCHGFDANGANYDEQGTFNNWWVDSDRKEFEDRQQQMIERYNELWAYDGVHANGEKTLGENMADLGGVRLAFELYRQKLIDEGRSQETINHQLREFFLHYAYLMQEDPSEEDLIIQLQTDEHSNGRNRVIGITRIMDEWYDLFHVTDGEWYLAPEDRVKIW